MNGTLDTIGARYSCRAYTGEKVEAAMLQAVAKAAVQAPSGMNKQPWEIYVVTNEAILADLEAACMDALRAMEDQSAYERIMERGGKVLYGAPAIFLVAAPEGSGLDCGIVSQNIALAATSLGLGNVICGLAALAFMGPRGADLERRIGFAPGCRFAMSVLVGHAVGEGTPHVPDMGKLHFVGE